MPKPERIWQFISVVLTVGLVAALTALYQVVPCALASKGMLPTVINADAATALVLSPAARRAHERYSL
ncbi:hypothetical protein ABIE20_001301 [Pseudomonas sp. 2835]